MGRRVPIDMAEYTRDAFREWVDRSRDNLGVDALDLVQLHCLPTRLYYRPISSPRSTSWSTDRCDRLLRGQRREGGGSAQSHRVPGRRDCPDHLQPLPPAPRRAFPLGGSRRDVGVLARVPLASGLLTGKLTRDTTFDADDHRRLQPSRRGVRRGRDLRRRGLRNRARDRRGAAAAGAPGGHHRPVRAALDPPARGRHNGHPGRQDAGAGACERCCRGLAPLPPATMARVGELYEARIKPLVHQRW